MESAIEAIEIIRMKRMESRYKDVVINDIVKALATHNEDVTSEIESSILLSATQYNIDVDILSKEVSSVMLYNIESVLRFAENIENINYDTLEYHANSYNYYEFMTSLFLNIIIYIKENKYIFRPWTTVTESIMKVCIKHHKCIDSSRIFSEVMKLTDIHQEYKVLYVKYIA